MRRSFLYAGLRSLGKRSAPGAPYTGIQIPLGAAFGLTWAACYFHTISLSTLLVLLLAGCGRGPSGDELVSQTKRILLDAHPDCTIGVAFNGIGEGDGDHAYAAIRLEAGPAGGRRSKDVEVLVSDWKSGRWEIQQNGSTQLVDAANQLCKG